jgi:hypothetical protein
VPDKVDTAASQVGPDLVALDGLEQAGRAAGRLRAGGTPVQHYYGLALPGAVKSGAQPQGTRPDDRDIHLHDLALTPPAAERRVLVASR